MQRQAQVEEEDCSARFPAVRELEQELVRAPGLYSEPRAALLSVESAHILPLPYKVQPFLSFCS